MSFEGYYQYRCACGRVDAADVYAAQPKACSVCGERFTARRMVEQTNGHDEWPWRDVEYRVRFKDYVAKAAERSKP